LRALENGSDSEAIAAPRAKPAVAAAPLVTPASHQVPPVSPVGRAAAIAAGTTVAASPSLALASAHAEVPANASAAASPQPASQPSGQPPGQPPAWQPVQLPLTSAAVPDTQQKLVGHLTKLWQCVLQRHAIGAQDSFSDCGGDAALGEQLLSRIELEFGRQLPPQALADGRVTVEQLAGQLYSHPEAPPWPTLAIIKPAAAEAPDGGDASAAGSDAGAARPPLICVHTAGGNLHHYYSLARALPANQAVVGLQARGVYDDHTPHHRVADIAAHCVDELLAQMPDGPWLLAGYSAGGVFALEIARQMRQRGHEPALLALLDTYVPSFQQRQRVVDHLALMRDPSYRYYYIERLQHWLLHPLRLDRWRCFCNAAAAHRWALWSYRPARYDGPVQLIRGAHSGGVEHRGWRPACSALEIVDMPYNHAQLMSNVGIRSVARHVDNAISEVLGGVRRAAPVAA